MNARFGTESAVGTEGSRRQERKCRWKSLQSWSVSEGKEVECGLGGLVYETS